MVIIEALISPQQVADYRKILTKVNWQDGAITAMGMAADVKRNSQANPRDPQIQALANNLLATMGEHASLVSAVLPHKIFPPCFNRYEANETYGYHVDASIMRLPNSQDVMRSDMSMTLFLSPPEDYEGGELLISTDFGEQRVKLRAGNAVVYPSSSLHQVTPVTKGTRLAAITWMQSLIPNPTTRQSLFELDRVIQDIAQNDDIERSKLDRLHHVYHNLVRQHSVV
ncbi:MAG: Fe2+-dependent dioxygenase [Paraglaciecola sp.]|uniref:Fe2+-dependent dioxygenase n=1 Tax=Pseudomonadati TaxID=3379134 RepID=UPI00273EB4EB|nr:Fe2+-dependent dioxygenase [Paraglaciecola sp.]MDP5029137.1 Fe2+-dependent dioxygenase [Paraglaciecola sp.]MDP5129410.1 Fe2+-dependent dioxygenase [Paraglaciecola sp.]